MKMQFTDEHQPVMVAEVLEGLNIRPSGIYVDATFGRGGHARLILDHLNQEGRLLAMDRDPKAELYAEKLAQNDPRFIFHAGPFSSIYTFCKKAGVVGSVAGILADLGVSSPQLDNPERGFSFSKDGPLDMRMDLRQKRTAAEWLNTASEQEIAEIFKTFGEERFSRRIAHAIILQRAEAPIQSTKQLAEIISKAHPAWEKHKHPATRCFQAIRIFINDELNELSLFLEQTLSLLRSGGRLCVISFHSLEDGIVKKFIQKQERGGDYPKDLPIEDNKIQRKLRRVGKAQKPTQQEIASNPRARSAVLRVAEKVAENREMLEENLEEYHV